MVVALNRAWLDCLPADCTNYNRLEVQADGQLWLLVASRVHPKTGELNALLLSPDRRRLVMAPAAEVAGFPELKGPHPAGTPGQKGVCQADTLDQKGADQARTPEPAAVVEPPVAQPVVAPAAVVSPPVAAAKPRERSSIASKASSAKPTTKPAAKPRAKDPVDVAANKLAREFKGEVIDLDPIGRLLEQELGLPAGSCS